MADDWDEKEKPFWVVFWPLEFFISGHDTEGEAAQAAASRNQRALRKGNRAEYRAVPRPNATGQD
jgi:hypothetical protein